MKNTVITAVMTESMIEGGPRAIAAHFMVSNPEKPPRRLDRKRQRFNRAWPQSLKHPAPAVLLNQQHAAKTWQTLISQQGKTAFFIQDVRDASCCKRPGPARALSAEAGLSQVCFKEGHQRRTLWHVDLGRHQIPHDIVWI